MNGCVSMAPGGTDGGLHYDRSHGEVVRSGQVLALIDGICGIWLRQGNVM